MKNMMITAALSLMVVSGAIAGEQSMTCSRQGGAPCTAQHVKQLETAVKAAAKGSRKELANVKSLSLASSNGTLKCKQTDGSACTAQQMQMVRDVSAASPNTVKLSN
jgi:hypothetical protein